MKTEAQRIVDQAAADLNAHGVTGFLILVKDPDTPKMYYRFGVDIQWSYGASEQMQAIFRKSWESDVGKKLDD